MPHISFIGDLTVDKYVRTHETRLGGAALNGAIWAKRLGADVSVISAVGDDEEGKKILTAATKEKINVEHVEVTHGKTSSIEIIVEPSGERSYGTWNPGTLELFHLHHSATDFLAKEDAIIVTPYPQYQHVMDELGVIGQTHHPFVVINYGDLGEFKKQLSVVSRWLPFTDVVAFGLDKNIDEALINSIRDLAQTEKKLALVTLGRDGSLVFAGDDFFVEPVRESKVINTTGAGDAFLTAFTLSFLKNKNVQQALAAGADLSSRVVGLDGAY